MSFSLRQLEYFLAVAQTGQISKAALRCHISQSSMTLALKALETALDTQLFIRHAKGLRLTESGERFLRHAEHVSGAVEDALVDMPAVPETVSGALHVGVTDTVSAYLMPALQAAFHRRFPLLRCVPVERSRADVERAVACGELDLALVLVSNLTPHEALDGETMLSSRRQLWLAPDHPLAERPRVSLRELAQHDFLLLDMDEHVDTAQGYWRRHGLTTPVHFQSKSIEGIRSMVSLGQGVTILSDLVFRPWSLEGKRIVRRSLSETVPAMDVGAVWSRTHGLSAHGRLFVDFARAALRQA